MRILMLSKALVVGAYHSKLARLAAQPDVELIAVTPPSWRDERGELRLEPTPPQGYRLIVTPLRFNGSFHLHYYPHFTRLLRQYQPDVVHLDEEPYNLATFLAMRAARQIKARTVFFSWQNLKRYYPPPFCWMERYVLRHADAGIVGNADAVQVWHDKGYAGPLVIIPQVGVEPDVLKPAAPPDGTPLFDRFVVGYAGRLIDDKGVDVLLEALAQLNAPWQAVVLGSGPERDRLIGLAGRLGIADRVQFLPWRASTEMAAFYHSLNTLVLPSRSKPNWKEQFGRVLVDAMACGVPVIGSTCGEIPHVIGEAGLIFPENDVAALRDRLRQLQGDVALRCDLAARGRQRVLERFTQEQIAQQTVEVYKHVMHDT
jgi:glycosyltransferase involved in cell wall biosynthesis